MPDVPRGRCRAERHGNGWPNSQPEYRSSGGLDRWFQMRRSRKICVVCGREIQWRKKWRNIWNQVKYCSHACRKTGLRDVDKALENMIMNLLHSRSSASSICPSEAARKYVGDQDEQKWRPLMELTRRAARRLAHRGAICILKDGKEVDPSEFKGPIRLKLRC